MSTPGESAGSRASEANHTPTVVAVLLALTLTLVIAVIGGGLLYLTLVHPSLIGPLSVSAAGITVIITLSGLLITLATSRRQ